MRLVEAQAGEIQSRRLKLQFPIEREVRYRYLKRGRITSSGAGKTLRISSREIRFTSSTRPSEGETVQLAVDWPALLDNGCPLKLEISGSVISSRSGMAAVSIAHYVFRTRGAVLKVNPGIQPAFRVSPFQLSP